MSEDCVVCTEELQAGSQPECQHPVHLRCIAQSGLDICPVCRQQVHFPVELQGLYEQRRTQIANERAAEQNTNDRQLARELQQQEQRQPRRMTRRRVARVAQMNEAQVEALDPATLIQAQPDIPDDAIIMRFNNTRFTIRPLPVAEGAMTPEDMMLAVNSIMYNVANRVQTFECDQRALQLYQFIINLNEVSALTGLSTSQLCSVIENTQ